MLGVDHEELMVMQMVKVFLSEGRYEGIVKSWLGGELIGCNLDGLVQLHVHDLHVQDCTGVLHMTNLQAHTQHCS